MGDSDAILPGRQGQRLRRSYPDDSTGRHGYCSPRCPPEVERIRESADPVDLGRGASIAVGPPSVVGVDHIHNDAGIGAGDRCGRTQRLARMVQTMQLPTLADEHLVGGDRDDHRGDTAGHRRMGGLPQDVTVGRPGRDHALVRGDGTRDDDVARRAHRHIGTNSAKRDPGTQIEPVGHGVDRELARPGGAGFPTGAIAQNRHQ